MKIGQLTRAGVVERPGADDVEPVGVDVDAREQIAGRLRHGVRVRRVDRRVLVDRESARRSV